MIFEEIAFNVNSDSHKFLSTYLVCFLINVDHICMCKKDVVSDYVRLGCRISRLTKCVKKDGASARRVQAVIIPLHCKGMRLVESDPVLHPVAKFLEACFGICCKILSGDI